LDVAESLNFRSKLINIVKIKLHVFFYYLIFLLSSRIHIEKEPVKKNRHFFVHICSKKVVFILLLISILGKPKIKFKLFELVLNLVSMAFILKSLYLFMNFFYYYFFLNKILKFNKLFNFCSHQQSVRMHRLWQGIGAQGQAHHSHAHSYRREALYL